MSNNVVMEEVIDQIVNIQVTENTQPPLPPLPPTPPTTPIHPIEPIQLSQSSETSEYSSTEQVEVTHVLGHRVSLMKTYQFQLEFADKTVEWVNDDKCMCEDIIGKYLRYKSINTAYLFCRVSRPEQATPFNFSLQAQEHELRKFVEKLRTDGKKYDRIRVYSIATSGYKKLPEVLRRIGYSTHQGDAICVWRCDRLSRNIVDSLDFIESIHKRGVMFYSYNENINYKDNKIRFIQAIVDANKEAMIIGERVKLSNNFKRLRGDEKIGSLPYGKKYEKQQTRKIVVDNEEEQNIIYRIKSSKLKASVLASQLNAEGIMKKNKKWNTQMIYRIKRS